jgi:alkylation response protein AidB-like acyl-CoA dehydrogenase
MTALDDAFTIDHLLTDEERGWRDRARAFAAARIAPTIEQDFEDAYFRHELVAELGSLGVLGMHLKDEGCAGPAPWPTASSATSSRPPTADGAPSCPCRAHWR